MKADLSNLAAPLLCIGCFSTLSVGCANQGTILELPQAPPAEHEPENLEQEGAKTSVEATTTPTPWFEQMPTELSVLAGNLPGAKRVAILVSGSEENSLSTSDNPVAPRPYDAVLGIYVNLINFFGQPLYSIGRPVSVDRLRAVLEALPEEEDVLFDVWAESRAGLALRYAVEHQPTGSLGPMRVVLVDVPNRGVSPTGWPTWEQRWDSYSPSPLVSGSAFLIWAEFEQRRRAGNDRLRRCGFG